MLNYQLQFLWTSAGIVNHYKNPRRYLIRIIFTKSSIFCPAFKFVIAMWWADLGQLPCARSVALTPLPQQNRGKKLDEKAHGPR